MADTTYRRTTGVITAEVDSDLVTMNVDTGDYLAFQDTARRIWELLEAPRTLDGLVATLAEEYDVDPSVARDDTLEFLGQMVKDGMVVAETA